MPLRLLTVLEAADFLRLRPQTLYNWVSEGRIASYKVGGRRLFAVEDLEAYLEERRRAASPHARDASRGA